MNCHPAEVCPITDQLERLRVAVQDRYLIERELGAGGMATVYLAQDAKLHRKVALKVLRPELAATLGSARFLREIEIVANLHHPHILGVHDSGEADGLLYFVMPYVHGESLRDRLHREKQLPVEDALQIAREVADALDCAHEHGVIHRDVKPENILLEGRHALVADFGIARALDMAGGDRMTGTGFAVGTPEVVSRNVSSDALLQSANAMVWVRLWPDSAERPLGFVRLRGETSPARALAVVNQLAYRGHLREAYTLARDLWPGWERLDLRAQQSWMLAEYGVVPREAARALLDECFEGAGVMETLCIYLSLRWAMQQGDVSSLERAMRWFDRARDFESPPVLFWPRSSEEWWETASQYFGGLARGYLALVQGDTAFALTTLPTGPACSVGYTCYAEVLTRAEVLAAMGRDQEAADLYLRMPFRLDVRPFPDIVAAALGRARANDYLGNRQEAIEAYAFVVDAWRNADPELQQVVEEARQALVRLTGETVR